METGKFPPDLLRRLLNTIELSDPSVLVGPGVGEDAAVLTPGGNLLVAKSDPITFATERAGWYAVHVNANDVACTGGTPRWFLSTLLVPEGYRTRQAEELFFQVVAACRAIGVSLVGGHSEVTSGVNRPLVLGTMIGEVKPERLVRTGGAQEGDSIVVTKGIAIEGTALLARERRRDLQAAGVEEEVITSSAALLDSPGISVINDAKIACDTVPVHSLHDVTEGGLITALREVAEASGLGLAIEEGSVPLLPETVAVCNALELDPMGLLASGAMIATLSAREAPRLLSALERAGINAWEIGQMLAADEGLVLFGRQGETELPSFDRDEIARYFSGSG